MNKVSLYKTLNFLIACVWLINGLYCKVLNFVPRHEYIIGEILGHKFLKQLTILIGLSEVVMAIWILSRYKSKLNAITQIVVVATMNIIEFIVVPNLLLWGKLNSLFAFLFIVVIYVKEFQLNKK